MTVIFGHTSNGSGVGCTTTVARSSGEGSSAVYNEGGIPAIPDQTRFQTLKIRCEPVQINPQAPSGTK
ncbi:hypothetical protein Tco_0956462, partial [Tanacetum coccineum]